jgi:leucyl aminopeptidase
MKSSSVKKTTPSAPVTKAVKPVAKKALAAKDPSHVVAEKPLKASKKAAKIAPAEPLTPVATKALKRGKKVADVVVVVDAEVKPVKASKKQVAEVVDAPAVTTEVTKKSAKKPTKDSTTTAKAVETRTKAPIKRIFAVENVIGTKFNKPKNGTVIGATVNVKTATEFTNTPDSAHVIFVSKESFGNELTNEDQTEDDSSNDEKDLTDDDNNTDNKSKSKKSVKKTDIKKTKAMDTKALTNLYNLIKWDTIIPSLKAQGFKATPGSVSAVPNINGSPVFLVGLGKANAKSKAFSPGTYRKAIAAATKAVKKLELPNIQIKLPNVDVQLKDETPVGYGNGVKGLKQQEVQLMTNDDKTIQSMRSMITANYSFDHYLKPATVEKKHFRIADITLISTPDEINTDTLHIATHRAESENLAKELGSLRSNFATNEYMKEQCEALVQAHPDVLKIKVLDKAALKEQGHNLILAVNQGSAIQPFIVGIEYTPPKFKVKSVDQDKSIVYIGKTLTFDTGGYSLKPSTSMDTMYTDKHGGCNTLALMRTLALTRPNTQHRIAGVLTITDNQIGPTAIHPSDVFQSPKGSVSIDNTDAEGRLALADAITFAQKEYSPKRITTMATLTGAIVMALGTNTGVFSNHKRIARELVDTAEQYGEGMWNMPIMSENHTVMERTETDLSNISSGKGMGSSTAAAFLEKFIDPKVSFVHLDIAGSSTAKDNSVTGSTLPTLQDIMSKH